MDRFLKWYHYINGACLRIHNKCIPINHSSRSDDNPLFIVMPQSKWVKGKTFTNIMVDHSQ